MDTSHISNKIGTWRKLHGDISFHSEFHHPAFRWFYPSQLELQVWRSTFVKKNPITSTCFVLRVEPLQFDGCGGWLLWKCDDTIYHGSTSCSCRVDANWRLQYRASSSDAARSKSAVPVYATTWPAALVPSSVLAYGAVGLRTVVRHRLWARFASQLVRTRVVGRPP